MTKIFVLKKNGALIPDGEESARVVGKIKDGATAIVEVKSPRNVKQLKFYWALLKKVHENQEYYATTKALHKAMKLATGQYEDVLHPLTGEITPVPDSISFDKMGQVAFDDYLRRVLDIIVTKVIPGLDREDLKNEVSQMCGISVGPL